MSRIDTFPSSRPGRGLVTFGVTLSLLLGSCLPSYSQTEVSYRRGSTVSLRDSFTGQEDQGPDFGLPYIDYGARQYSPALSRWLVPDPMGEKYYDVSPYVYCSGNPLRYIDPDGKDGWDTTWGYIIGGITNILPGSSQLRDWYQPNDVKDYNRALENCDRAAAAVGGAMVDGGKWLTKAGTGMMGAGAGIMGTGGILMLSGAGTPEGSVVIVGGAKVLTAGKSATEAGVAATAGGMDLMMNAANNSSKNRGRNCRRELIMPHQEKSRGI